MSDALTGWTIYRSPRDYPGQFVARRWIVPTGGDLMATNEMFTADTLNELRQLLPLGLVNIGRMPGDEPQIVEVWI